MFHKFLVTVMNGLRTAFLAALLFLTTARACPAGPLDRVRQAFVDVSVMSYAPDGEATERFVRYSDYGRANDVLLLQLYTSVHLPDGEVRRLLGLFDAGGFWSDIDYDDRTRGRWQPSLHLTRMYALAKLYADPASAWHGDGRIGGLLHKGLAYWYAKKPSSLNWWHGEIGVPKKLAAILLMIRGELSGPELEQGLRIIERSRFGRTGQNKVWLAGNNLMRGLLTDDEALVAGIRSPRRSSSPTARAFRTTGRFTSTDPRFSSGTTDWPMPRASRSGSEFSTGRLICSRTRSAPSSKS